MLWIEISFFACFLVVIVGILMLDMLVIDRKAHEVPISEAAGWTVFWIVLSLLFAVFLWFHGDLVHGIGSMDELRQVVDRYAQHLDVDALGFEEGLKEYREHMTLNYISAYLIEKTLSVDNLFVMLMVFTSFGVPKRDYQRVLFWGILGAIVLRFIFIFVGAAVVRKFSWILVVFGLFLVYSALKMFFEKDKEESIDVERHPVVRFLSRYFRVYPRFSGDRFVVRARREGGEYVLADRKDGGRLCLTPMLVTLVVIEFCDIIFAFDSIPAAFSVTLDPYVIFFANIFAILGLRAMFFLLSAIADRFRFLKTGVCVLLLFIGVKLLIRNYVEISSTVSLAVILSVLALSIVLSLLIPENKETV